MAGLRSLDVVVEQGRRRTFVAVLDWPGWCRSARTRDGLDSALDALVDYRDRYARAMGPEASLRVPARFEFCVVDTVAGNATTDFGAPDARVAADPDPMAPRELSRHLACLRAAWTTLDDVAAHAPEVLRKGPRGGGRDRTAVLDHVREAERAYGRGIGLRLPPRTPDGEQREALLQTLRERNADQPTDTRWPVRYTIRRIAWHVLDHAWEIEDKATPDPE
jgi:hypothetical protein